MRFLDEANSWSLLSKTVFGDKGSCPIELEKIGKKIAKGCKGLPLAIAVIGGCLAKSIHTTEFWGHIEENLNSIVNLEDNERCLRTLHMSYKHLSVHLKPCFLYMGVFSEDEVIRVSKLIKMWVAEGFVKPIPGKILEDAAREYLKDLVDRNLIMIHKVGSIGNMKHCKVHDLLRDLCLREAEKERFYIVARPHTLRAIMNGQRRIVISRSTSKKGVVDAMQSRSVARSLISDFLKLLPQFGIRMLRILSTFKLLSTKDANSLKTVFRLVNLQYLDINAHLVDRKPQLSPLYQLWNLQTFIFDGLWGITAPTAIWNMSQIRHVKFSGLRLPNPPGKRGGIVLGNLQTLVTVIDLDCSEDVVRRIPNIKKLRVSSKSHHLSNLVCLHKLESFGYESSDASSLQNLEFPHSLKKLTLEIQDNERWEAMMEKILEIQDNESWEAILGKIGALPFLEKLKLCSGSFEGSRWETMEGQFHSLKYLEICYSRLKIWTMESSHFPRLERLVLQCVFLEEIPLDFAEIPTLGLIELKYCGESVAISAKRIVEEQEALYGEVSLQVQVIDVPKNEALELLAAPNFRVQ